MRSIDLNVDLGEGFPHDDALLDYASSGNVCCGVHAGSPDITLQTIDSMARRRKRIGVHPGYPDRESMGRAASTPETLRTYLTSVFDQVREFQRIVPAAYLKPHGGLYNDTGAVVPARWADRIPEPVGGVDPVALFLVQVPAANSLGMLMRLYKLPLMGMATTAHRLIAHRAGYPLWREGFVDRAYRADGTLAPRSQPGAVLQDPGLIRNQVLRLAPRVDSLCLHGDTPDAVSIAELVTKTLRDAGYRVEAPV